MTRVWNITDGGQKGVHPHNRMVLGKQIKPGHFLKVDESRLAGATKIEKDVSAGMLHVGGQPPQWYAQKKKPPRAVADGRIVDSDGRSTGKKVVVAPGHADLTGSITTLPEPPLVAAKVEEPVAHEAPEVSEEETRGESEDEGSGFSRRRKKRK